MRTLCAWQRDGKFYLSAMLGERTLGGRTPAKEFDSRADLEAFARGMTDRNRRPAQIEWEYIEDAE